MTRYLPLLEALDRWQGAAHARHGDLVPCRRGCSACCHGPFDITAADAATVLEGLAALDPEARREVIARARAQVDQMRALEPAWSPPYDVADLGEARFDRLTEALADLPCPLLDSGGACRAYRHRPFVCRVIGLGLENESGGVIPNACPVQDRFPGYASLPPAAFPLEAWERDERRAVEEATERMFGTGVRSGYETTIATAIALFGPLPEDEA